MLKSRTRYKKAKMDPIDMAQTVFSHFIYMFFSVGLEVFFFILWIFLFLHLTVWTMH